ncbi:MAG: hypothetical protein RL839_14235 [Gammaproteobacteria bacterium]
MEKIEGFFAYASSPHQLTKVISEAVEAANRSGWCHFATWEESDIAGRPLTAPIFSGLENANVLVADITSMNFNVTFEIGYAIGIGRRIFLTKSTEFKSEDDLINRIGIFDTLGFETYSNAEQLSKLISGIRDLHPIDTTSKPNLTTPLYVLETPIRGGVMSNIISRIKKARLFYRSFIPGEASRLSAPDAISHVSSSYGVVVPLLSPDMKDSDVHNIRSAFITGLSLGLEIPTLLLQDQASPLAPLDVRDFVKSYSRPEDLKEYIHEFSLTVYERIQETKNLALPVGNLLSTVSIGDPMAENELQSLGDYYLQTNEFNRALRGEVNLVVGRKGTGKTALFSQVRNKKRSDKNNVVVDLKPEGYQLLKLKEEVLNYLTPGAKNHLVTALWEYLLYAEICRTVLKKDSDRHVRDHILYDSYIELQRLYAGSSHNTEGDFSERLLALSSSVAQDFAAKFRTGDKLKLTGDEITELLHAGNILELRKALYGYLRHKGEVWLLFDNLDKGWSSYGPETGDIIILRCLIDAARKIQRQLSKDGLQFHTIVFIRNDVFQLLMDETSDFGKETRADLDWSDPDLLRSMMRMRLVQNNFPPDTSFDEVWNTICVSHIDGEETAQYMIDRSLMRPRNFLKLFGACKGFAVNMQHDKIEADDITKGLNAYSNDLLIDADQELTDIESKASRIIYQFLGESSEFTGDDLRILLDANGLTPEQVDQVIEFLLYYGFLGIRYSDNEPQYIYDVGYNMEIMNTRIAKNKNAITYTFNPAFYPALHIQQ